MIFRTSYSLDVFLSITFLLFRLLIKFSAPNLLALHPPLSQGFDENCATCYDEHENSKNSVSGVDSRSAVGRGLVTEDNFKVCRCVVFYKEEEFL